MYYVYVLQNELDQLYFGSTNDLKRRLHEHQNHKNRSTKGFSWTLIYYEAYQAESDARQREHMIKHNGGTKRALKSRILRSRQLES